MRHKAIYFLQKPSILLTENSLLACYFEVPGLNHTCSFSEALGVSAVLVTDSALSLQIVFC